jgi:hypothetical protein
MARNKSIESLVNSRPALFEPDVVRGIIEKPEGSAYFKKYVGDDFKGSNEELSSSFKFDIEGEGVVSTQQLNIDWTNFGNHTFFNSAQVKTNVSFDKIIKEFPFDGTFEETENFFSNLTGFEKYVYDSFPKNNGYLFFSGTNVGESFGGTYIITPDIEGANFPMVSKMSGGKTIINPGFKPMTVEMSIFVPDEPNENSVILDKHTQTTPGNNQGFYVALSGSTTNTARAEFFVLSGTTYDQVPVEFEKGQWNHLAWVWDRTPGVEKVCSYVNQQLFASSSQIVIEFGEIRSEAAELLIGSGSALENIFEPETTLSGALDELRIWHSVRNKRQLEEFSKQTLYADPDLKLYYKFNEPSGSNSNIVLDHSSNSLHGKLSAFSTLLNVRNIPTGSIAGPSPIEYETIELSPILFPQHPKVISLREALLERGKAFDFENPNLITKLIPSHYLLEGQVAEAFQEVEGTIIDMLASDAEPRSQQLGETQVLLLMLYTWAKFFDEMNLFIQAFSTLNHLDYDMPDTMPDNFLEFYANKFGIKIPSLFTGSTIEQYIEGKNIQDVFSVNDMSLQKVKNQIWRRLLINMRDFIGSKGTIHSVKSFIRGSGIDPDNNFRIREFGGPSQKNLSFSKEKKSEISTMLSFVSGGLLRSPFLVSEKIEPGFPFNGPDSDSNNLLTSGSWTFEAIYKFNPQLDYETEQSLVRLNVAGPDTNEEDGIVVNVIAKRSGGVEAYFRPDNDVNATFLVVSTSSDANLFNGQKWNMAVGRQRNDDNLQSDISSSYFLRVAQQNNGEEPNFYKEKVWFNDSPQGGAVENIFQNISSDWNTSGSYFIVGSQSVDTSVLRFLNDDAEVTSGLARETGFKGSVSQIRFWSKFITEKEWAEHVRNFKSVGVEKPETNFNFVSNKDKSFQRLRMDISTDQPQTSTDGSGNIVLTDFSQNDFEVIGTGFPSESNVIRPERFYFSFLSPNFDQAATFEKVRVRGFEKLENTENAPWSQVGPVYDLLASEPVMDDVRFTIDISVIDYLNEDIMTIFSSLESFDNILGSPELAFSDNYPNLEALREVYFNKLTDKVNFKDFFQFFKWIDTSFTSFITQLVPRKTKFLGTNFVIQSHVLERSKFSYRYEDNYLGENNRGSLRPVIKLQLVEGGFSRY